MLVWPTLRCLNGLSALLCLIGSLVLGFSGARAEVSKTPDVYHTRVVIVGGGAAGLMSALILKEAGIPFVLLEMAERVGGRVSSRADFTQMGLVVDDGANLLNSTDRTALALMARFHIPFVARLKSGDDHMAFMFDGKVHSQKQAETLLFEKNLSVLWRIARDQVIYKRKKSPAFREKAIHTSIANYLQELGADPLLRNLLNSFFWSEYGRTTDELNLIVLFDYFHLDYAKNRFHLIPNVDEAYTLPNGMGQITSALENEVREHIRYGHRVEKIYSNLDGTITVEAPNAVGTPRVVADYIVYAAPLHALDKMQVDVRGIHERTLQQARDASYGRGAKIHLKFAPGFHDVYKFNGIFVTDTGEQIWTSSLGQNGAGLLTVLTGPIIESPVLFENRVKQILKQLDKLAPGVSKLFVGYERNDVAATYSGALQPGQIYKMEINNRPGRWITVGEASGGPLQGYLEGALKSAREKTERLVGKLQKADSKSAQTVNSSGHGLVCEDDLWGQ